MLAKTQRNHFTEVSSLDGEAGREQRGQLARLTTLHLAITANLNLTFQKKKTYFLCLFHCFFPVAGVKW